MGIRPVPHGQSPMRGSAFEEVFEELGVYDEFEPTLEPDDPRDIVTLSYRRREWDEYKTVTQKQAMADPTPFFRLWEATEEEQEKTIAVMTELVTMEDDDIAKLDNITMKEWLEARDVPAPLYNYMGFQANASLAEPLDLVAASEQILIMKQFMLQGGGGQYKGGFGQLTTIMAREFERNGGTLITGARVERIVVEDGAVKGVESAKGNFTAPVVVSSAGIQPTVLKLVGEKYFDESYVNYVKALVPGWSFTSVRYFLNKPVMDTAIYVVWSDDSWLDTERFRKQKEGEEPDEVILFMCNHSFYDDNAAPPRQAGAGLGNGLLAEPPTRRRSRASGAAWTARCRSCSRRSGRRRSARSTTALATSPTSRATRCCPARVASASVWRRSSASAVR
ncbi:MAG: hypothetical protein M5U19_20925 [Microthrixaceae bacterium]|nr:hypothetical protein [Microthrixaceae bacterium]